MRIRDEAKEIAIREQAIAIIVQQGISGLTMKDLASACGISASTIYVYYQNKEDLISQLCLWVRLDMLRYSLRGLKPEMSLKEGLLLQWQNRFRYFLDYPLNVQAGEQLKYSPQYNKTTPQLIEAVGPELKEFMDNAVKKGELAVMPFELYWAIAFAPLYQLIEFHIANSSFGSPSFSLSTQILTTAVERIVRSLKV